MTPTRTEAISGLTFGSILINTLPVWLEELATRFSLSTDEAGLLATLVLLSAGAACWAHSAARHWSLDLGAAMLAVVLLVLARTPPDLSVAAVFGAGVVFGAAIGVVLARSIAGAFAEPDTLKTISISLTVALLVSLVIILVSAQSGITAIGQIALCAAAYAGLLCMAVRRPQAGADSELRAGWLPHWRALLFLPFFIAMGGFWAFAELYGNAHSIPNVKLVLAASYLASAVGSALVNFVRVERMAFWRLFSLAISAASAAWVYSTTSAVMFSVMFLLNSLFLFVFLPLYLTGSDGDDVTSNPQAKIALYLFGFAVGGVFAGIVITQFGYAVFAGFIVFSILPAFASARGRA